ncbi:hypothetical protein P4311_07460 [Bacillus thuringiensis]|nr:hypothetical protein [Bacillus thuringiensis]MRB59379.1 hypothetical protein [Bacillus thuringiensis]
MFEWLNSLKDYMGTFSTNYPALAAATLTGSVTFVAGMLSQVLSHRFTKKREREKSLRDAITRLYSPFSAEIYTYLYYRGNFLDPLSLPQEKQSQYQKALDDSWDKMNKILANNTQFITLELSHNFQQAHYFGRDITFFKNFFEEFNKISKEISFEAKFESYTASEMLYIFKFYQLVSSRYGKRSGLYTFKLMTDEFELLSHSIPFKKFYKQLKKEKFLHYDLERNSFDDKFETLVLDNISKRNKSDWKKYIKKDLDGRKEYIRQFGV